MDDRREVNAIFKELDRLHKKVGESVVWFKFDLTSTYDDIYDEGFRDYSTGILVPTIWIDQMEDTETQGDEGRRTTQRFRCAISARSLNETGIGATEAHGERLWDTQYDKPWSNDRLNDLIYYDGRFYAISNFQIRGRARQDVIVGVAGIETQPDERVWDLFPY